jgi:hypothetical protein
MRWANRFCTSSRHTQSLFTRLSPGRQRQYVFQGRKGFRESNIVTADYNTGFPAGINVAATWSRDLAYARGQAMGEEHRGKGVDVQLGPVCGPLGRAPEGGRNWVG